MYDNFIKIKDYLSNQSTKSEDKGLLCLVPFPPPGEFLKFWSLAKDVFYVLVERMPK